MPPNCLEGKLVTLQRQFDAARVSWLANYAEVDRVEAATKQQGIRPADGGLTQSCGGLDWAELLNNSTGM